jgi:hypothetical protein
MTKIKYIGLDVHQASSSIAVRDESGKLVMQSVVATRAGAILEFLDGLRGTLRLTFEEGTYSTWLHDLLARRVSQVVVCGVPYPFPEKPPVLRRRRKEWDYNNRPCRKDCAVFTPVVNDTLSPAVVISGSHSWLGTSPRSVS